MTLFREKMRVALTLAVLASVLAAADVRKAYAPAVQSYSGTPRTLNIAEQRSSAAA